MKCDVKDCEDTFTINIWINFDTGKLVFENVIVNICKKHVDELESNGVHVHP